MSEERGKREFKQFERIDRWKGNGALKARYEALPQTPPGGKPPETPGPLSLEIDFMSQGRFVKGSLRRQKTPPLTNLPCSGDLPGIRERGPGGRGCKHSQPPVGRPKEWPKTRNGRSVLDKYRPSHGRRCRPPASEARPARVQAAARSDPAFQLLKKPVFRFPVQTPDSYL